MSISFSSSYSNAFFVGNIKSQFEGDAKNALIKVADDNLGEIMLKLHIYEFNTFSVSADLKDFASIEDDIDPILLKKELCASNPACAYNCELVPSTENYTVVLNKTVAEDN